MCWTCSIVIAISDWCLFIFRKWITIYVCTVVEFYELRRCVVESVRFMNRLAISAQHLFCFDLNLCICRYFRLVWYFNSLIDMVKLAALWCLVMYDRTVEVLDKCGFFLFSMMFFLNLLYIGCFLKFEVISYLVEK